MSTLGTIEWVDVALARSFLVGDHAAAATTLTVGSTQPFGSAGSVLILGVTYTYTVTDAVTLVVAPGLAESAEDGIPVDLVGSGEKRAGVTLPAGSGDSLVCRVPMEMRAYQALGLGMRAPGEGETVSLQRDGTGWVVADVLNVEGDVQGSAVVGPMPNAEIGDGLAPTVAPTITVEPFAVGAVSVSWPVVSNNGDPTTFYKVHASLTSPVATDGSKLVGQTSGTAFRIANVDGAPIPINTGTDPVQPTVYVKVQTFDADGAGPFSTEGSAVPRASDAFITAAFIAAMEIQAQQIIAGDITADLGLLSKLMVGGFVEIDGATSAMTIYADLLHTIPLVQLRPEGSVFRGKVIADDVSVLNGLIMMGTQSQIAQAAGLTIMAGVADPTSAPTLSATTSQSTWPAVPSGFKERGICWDATDSVWLRLLVPSSGSVAGACKVEKVNTAGAVTGSVTLANIVGIGEDDLNGIIRIGSSYYCAVYDSYDDRWRAVKWSTTGTYQATATASGVQIYGPATVGSSGTNLILCGVYDKLGVTTFGTVEYDPSTLAVVGGLDAAYPSADSTSGVMFAGLANFDFGAPRFVVQHSGYVFVFELISGVWTSIPGKSFQLSSIGPGAGMAWNGASWFSTHSAKTLHKYSGYYPAASEKAYVTYADTATSPARITLDSPPANLAVPARRWLQVALSPSGAESSDVFMGLGTSLPADTALLKRPETLTGRNMLVDPSVAGGTGHSTLRTVSAVTRSGTIATATTTAAHGYAVGNEVELKGAAAPLSGIFVVTTVPDSTHFTYDVPNSGSTSSSGTAQANTFGAGTSGWIKSATGGLALYGDGVAKVARVPMATDDVANKAYVDAAAADEAITRVSAYNSGTPTATGMFLAAALTGHTFGAAVYFRKIAPNLVKLGGIVAHSSNFSTTFVDVFQLPANYRPNTGDANNQQFFMLGGTSATVYGRARVSDNGMVAVQSSAAASYLSLDGIIVDLRAAR